MNLEISKIMRRPDIVERFAKDAVDTLSGTRAEFAAIVRSDIVKWTKVIREQNIRPE